MSIADVASIMQPTFIRSSPSFVVALVALPVFLASSGCSSNDGSASRDASPAVDSVGADGGKGVVVSHEPAQHRPSDAACAAAAAPGNCTSTSMANGACTSDSECTAGGTNGRCLQAEYGVASTSEPTCSCAYDACSGDAACADHTTCACHGAPYTSGAASACVPGNCRIDSDCGANGYCSPSSATGVCGDSLAGYFCHTANDTCTDDSDCAPDGGDTFENRCIYSTTSGAWSCVNVSVCG